jgi:hypothetical protein
MRKRGGVYRVLMGKPEGKRTYGKHRHRWDGYITMEVQEL